MGAVGGMLFPARWIIGSDEPWDPFGPSEDEDFCECDPQQTGGTRECPIHGDPEFFAGVDQGGL